MAETSNHSRWPAYVRVPPFFPVPMRARADGWSDQRQANFIGYLAELGCVAEAARRVGMSRMSAYRLRRRAGARSSLVHAWDAVLAARRGQERPNRKVTPDELPRHAFEGAYTVVMRRGRFVCAWRKPSTSALLRYLRLMDRVVARLGDWEG